MFQGFKELKTWDNINRMILVHVKHPEKMIRAKPGQGVAANRVPKVKPVFIAKSFIQLMSNESTTNFKIIPNVIVFYIQSKKDN